MIDTFVALDDGKQVENDRIQHQGREDIEDGFPQSICSGAYLPAIEGV